MLCACLSRMRAEGSSVEGDAVLGEEGGRGASFKVEIPRVVGDGTGGL